MTREDIVNVTALATMGLMQMDKESDEYEEAKASLTQFLIEAAHEEAMKSITQ